MTGHLPRPALLPPPGLPGLDPAWSRLVTLPDADGVRRTWHLLDSGTPATEGTLLCVHGNPTWSYLWRRLVAAPPAGWRVVAPDQLGMGFSQRLEGPRSLAQRIADLGSLTDGLGLDGDVVTVAHDWGGPISLGWAQAHRHQVRGVVLTNTGVHQPSGDAVPALIRLARSPLLRDTSCVRTPVFVRAATALSRPALPRAVREAYAAPYATADRRRAVGDFVADIPLDPGHPSGPTLDAVRDGLAELADVPVLLLWGPRDPVFRERYLRDLLARLPQAQVHRYEGASHLVVEDAPRAVAAVATWVADLRCRAPGRSVSATPEPPGRPAAAAAPGAPSPAPGSRPAWAALDDRAGNPTAALVQLSGGTTRAVSFGDLDARVRHLAAGLSVIGVRPGDRIALLVPPGPDLAAVLYACWRAGAVAVIADAGLGLRALGRALRGAGPAYVVAIPRGLVAARALGIPGRRIGVGVEPRVRRALGAELDVADVERLGGGQPLPAPPPADADAAVVFTSGATGPPKGVVYRHGQLSSQVAALRATYGITAKDRIVAAFAPFALYGPALGITSVVPDVYVTAPASLTARTLAEAVAAAGATIVFAAPAALRTVVGSAAALTDADRAALAGVRLLMSAGAPVPVPLLEQVQSVLPNAELHTPYGMTEALPVTDVSLAELHGVRGGAGSRDGVCVGRPVTGVEVRVASLAPDGTTDAGPVELVEVTGELCVRAAHVKDRYDRLWATERMASRDEGWHRTGDVGRIDAEGRVWVEGRLAHVVVTARGVVTPVGVEQRVEALRSVSAAAVAGVGPVGTQQVVVVVVPAGAVAAPSRSRGPLAEAALASAVREAAGVEVAAVLVTDRLPVDIRHQSKVDRRRVSAWASRVLAGHRAARRP